MTLDHRVEFASVLLLTMTLTVLISLTGADLSLSSYFYYSDGWPIGEFFPWKPLYYLGGYPAYALALFGLGIACLGGFSSQKPLLRRRGIFLVLLLTLGPGSLVNGVLKNMWGRPRPCQTIEFGGDKQFRHPWQPDMKGETGRSFPSGHASAAFYLTAPFFIYRRENPDIARQWLAGGIFFGFLMSIARIAQGGHFLSDTLWAWALVHLLGLALSSVLLPHHEKHEKNPILAGVLREA